MAPALSNLVLKANNNRLIDYAQNIFYSWVLFFNSICGHRHLIAEKSFPILFSASEVPL